MTKEQQLSMLEALCDSIYKSSKKTLEVPIPDFALDSSRRRNNGYVGIITRYFSSALSVQYYYLFCLVVCGVWY